MNFATWGAVPFALRGTQDYIAISIGGRDGQCWTLATDGPIVTAAIAHVRSCFYVHQRRIVLAGYSSGGMLAYKLAMANALTYAGVLIENSGLSQAVGGGNVDSTLDAASWSINVAHSARLGDLSFPIAGVRSDRDKMLAHGIPLQYRELAGTHDGTSADWSDYLIPKMATWVTP
jgi:predicted esterase